MTVRPVARLFAGAALVVLAATACSKPSTSQDDPTPAPSSMAAGEATLGTSEPRTPAPSPSAGSDPGERMPASWRACDNPPAGYSIGYPADWHAAEGQYRCQFFHPDPFTIVPNSEIPRLALNAVQSPESVATYRAQMTDPTYYTVVRDEAVTVLDRPGFRFETVTLGEGLDDPGVRRYGYIIDNGAGRAFVVWTVALPGDTRYDNWKSIVDTARDSVRFLH